MCSTDKTYVSFVGCVAATFWAEIICFVWVHASLTPFVCCYPNTLKIYLKIALKEIFKTVKHGETKTKKEKEKLNNQPGKKKLKSEVSPVLLCFSILFRLALTR